MEPRIDSIPPVEPWRRATLLPRLPSRYRLAVALLLALAAFGALALSAVVASAQQPKLLMGSPARGEGPLPKIDALLEKDIAAYDDVPQLRVVVDTPYEIWSGTPSYVHVVVYTPTFAPAAGAWVYVDHKPVGITDASGSLAFELDFNAEEGSQERWLRAVWGAGARPLHGEVTFSALRRTESFEQSQLFVYTDRGIYNPGQTIHVRALAWRLRGEYTPLKDEAVELTLLDSAGRVAAGARLKTDSFGVVSMDLPLPQAMPEGRYALAIQFGEAREEAELRVERFVPPAIKIDHDLPRYITFDQKKLEFEVKLTSFVGRAPTGGELKVKVESPKREVWSTQRVVEGAASWRFTLEGEALKQLQADTPDGDTFRVTLEARDQDGRTDVLRRDIRLSSQPFTVVVENDKDEYARGEVATIQVKVVDLDDAPVVGRAVTLVEVEGPTRLKVRTDAAGIAQFKIKVSKEFYDFDVFIQDVEAPVGVTSLAVVEEKGMLSRVATPVVQERKDVTIEVALRPGFVPTEGYVHGDVVDASGALVQAFRLPLSNAGGRWVARGAFPAPTWGTMLLTLFCAGRRASHPVQRTGLLVEGQQITVLPDKALKVTLGGVPRQVAPGGAFTLDVQVSDARGRRVRSAVGASAVDAAVLSLLNPLEVAPAARFYNPELKVLSTTGSKILTWPVVSRNWGELQMDIALPPFPALDGDYDPSGPMARMPSAAAKTSPKGAMGFGNLSLDGFSGGSIGSSGMGAGSAVGAGKISGAKKVITLSEVTVQGSIQKPEAALVEAGEEQAGRRPGEGPGGAPAAQITIRRSFPETALWLPSLVAEGGAVSIPVRLPDTITRQTVTVVASDAQGGVGVAQAEVEVSREVFVRADLPATLTAGDVVQVQAAVQNLGKRPVKATLQLESAALELRSAGSVEVSAPPGGVGVGVFEVRAKQPGAAAWRLTARGPGAKGIDGLEGALHVRPAGPLRLETSRGVASAEAPFTRTITFEPGDEALLAIGFPSGAALVEELTRWALDPAGLIESPGALSSCAGWLLKLLARQGALTPELRARLREAIAADLLLLSQLRSPSGAWVFWRTQAPSPYLTGRALAGLVVAREADFVVPDAWLQAAGAVILEAVDKDGLVDTSDIGWWEGQALPRRRALSAELFRVVAEAGPSAVPEALRPQLQRLGQAAQRWLKESDDPLTLANAALGLRAWQAGFKDADAAPLDGRAVVSRLLRARRQGHWEPSWFNADGGTLLTTAAVIELIQALDAEEAQPLLRESVQVLLAARPGLGSWHNMAGTVAAVRALAHLPPQKETRAAQVSIRVNGVEVNASAVDPRDPWASTLKVALTDLTPWLKAGSNAVEVRYDGALEPLVRLDLRTPRPSSGALPVARRLSSSQLRPGESLTVEYALSPLGPGPVRLIQALPHALTPDLPQLDALREEGVILEYHAGSELVVVLPPRHGDLKLRLIAAAPTQATLSPARAVGLGGQSWQVGAPAALRVAAP